MHHRIFSLLSSRARRGGEGNLRFCMPDIFWFQFAMWRDLDCGGWSSWFNGAQFNCEVRRYFPFPPSSSSSYFFMAAFVGGFSFIPFHFLSLIFLIWFGKALRDSLDWLSGRSSFRATEQKMRWPSNRCDTDVKDAIGQVVTPWITRH